MSDFTGNVLPTPAEFFLDGRRFIQYGISPVKMAAIRIRERKNKKGTRSNPIIKEGKEYIKLSDGRLVQLDHYDPQTMEKFSLSKDAVLTKEAIDRLDEFASKKIEPDEDCPELTDDQIESIMQKALAQKEQK